MLHCVTMTKERRLGFALTGVDCAERTKRGKKDVIVICASLFPTHLRYIFRCCAASLATLATLRPYSMLFQSSLGLAV